MFRPGCDIETMNQIRVLFRQKLPLLSAKGILSADVARVMISIDSLIR
jgi:hypothetical protein